MSKVRRHVALRVRLPDDGLPFYEVMDSMSDFLLLLLGKAVVASGAVHSTSPRENPSQYTLGGESSAHHIRSGRDGEVQGGHRNESSVFHN